MTELPKAVSSETLILGGISIECHVLDDGRRVIEQSSLHKLFSSDHSLTVEEAQALANWTHGGNHDPVV